MSLINDALKRAKQSQQENPPATPPLEFRPVEPAQQGQNRSALLYVGLTCIAVAILGLSGLLVQMIAQSKSNTLQVAARTIEPPSTPLEATAPTPAPERIPAPLPASPAVTAPDSGPKAPPAAANPTTAPEPVAVVEVSKPAPPKLQGIFFNPQNPSAVVDGRSVYLGDRVSSYRVIGISPVAVTLVSATETNVLSLSGH